MTKELMEKWKELVWEKQTMERQKNSLLFLDHAGRIHDDIVLNHTNIHYFVPNTTADFQPMDLTVNR